MYYGIELNISLLIHGLSLTFRSINIIDVYILINVMIHEQLQILLVKTSLVVRLNILIMFENIC